VVNRIERWGITFAAVLAFNACQLVAGIDDREVAPPKTSTGAAGTSGSSTSTSPTSSGSAGTGGTASTTGFGGSSGSSGGTGGGGSGGGGTGGSSQMEAGLEASPDGGADAPDALEEPGVADAGVDAPADAAENEDATTDASAD
jgi:hypothetical protein